MNSIAGVSNFFTRLFVPRVIRWSTTHRRDQKFIESEKSSWNLWSRYVALDFDTADEHRLLNQQPHYSTIGKHQKIKTVRRLDLTTKL